MKQFEAIYEVGPHQSVDIIVDAKNEKSARTKADKEAKDYNNPMFVRIRELEPVSRLDHEREIRSRDQQITVLQQKIRDIITIVGEDNGYAKF